MMMMMLMVIMMMMMMIMMMIMMMNLFRKLGPEKHVIFLKDISASHLELLLEYMYQGEIKVRKDNDEMMIVMMKMMVIMMMMVTTSWTLANGSFSGRTNQLQNSLCQPVVLLSLNL